VTKDAPDFKKAFDKAGVKASINNALNDPLKQKAQAQACLAAGADRKSTRLNSSHIL